MRASKVIVVILRGLVIGVVGGAVLLAGVYALVLLVLGLGLLAAVSGVGHPGNVPRISGGLFYGLFAVALIVIGWRMIRSFLLPSS